MEPDEARDDGVGAGDHGAGDVRLHQCAARRRRSHLLPDQPGKDQQLDARGRACERLAGIFAPEVREGDPRDEGTEGEEGAIDRTGSQVGAQRPRAADGGGDARGAGDGTQRSEVTDRFQRHRRREGQEEGERDAPGREVAGCGRRGSVHPRRGRQRHALRHSSRTRSAALIVGWFFGDDSYAPGTLGGLYDQLSGGSTS